MSARPPSLDLVRSFVAVGRRMSITRAAADLHLTQSAVSRQVHALEQHLGVRLLVRSHRAVAFTAEGERLFRVADASVHQLHAVLAELATSTAVKPVTLSASIGFTTLWLLPRLSRLQARHPDVDVRVSAHNRVMDLRNDGIDLAVRYTSAAQVPAGALRLFGEQVVPVASPALGLTTLADVRALAPVALLEFEEPRYPWLQWRHWLSRRGWPGAKSRTTLRFNQYDLVIQAALAGQGVALGRRGLIQPLLADGRLVALAPPMADFEQDYGYWLLRAGMPPRAGVAQVADWIVAEATREHAGVPREPG
jgi:LysR family glycine cleavage system transcriptional activator